MNWRQGFVRLWIAGSLAWAVGVLVDAYGSWPGDGARYTIALPERQNGQPIDYAKELFNQGLRGKSGERPAVTDPDVLRQLDARLAADRWRAAYSAAWALILPPAIIFLFGMTMAWIGRGFKSPRT